MPIPGSKASENDGIIGEISHSAARRLFVHSWGPEGAPRVVCLHGVTSWGGHFAELASRALTGYRVLAPDLLGHGSSPQAPPWSIAHQIDAVLATLGEEPAMWLGHSFGGRLAFELAAARPELVERLVLLDPAIIPGGDDRLLALAEDARTRRTYASFEELVDRRMEESFLSHAPRELVADELRHHVAETAEGVWQYRYVQSAAVTVYAELAIPPAPFDEIRAPTLLLRGATSYVPLDAVVPAFSKALGDRLEVVTVPGGHTVLWDALPETADAVAAFLAR